jgi:GTP cyclohydrolase IA
MDFKEEYVRQLIESLDEDVDRDGLSETPRRFSAACDEIFSGYDTDPNECVKVFDSEGYDEMIIAHDIDFYSTCEHHLLPFFGKVYIGYVPRDYLIGLSKFARLVDCFARRLQIQERFTSQLAEFLDGKLKAKGVGVVVKAQHLCMLARGVKSKGSNVTTSSFKGLFRKDEKTRAEFLGLI